MPLQWRAVDAEGLSRWRLERELAIQDAAALLRAGEENVFVEWRIATRPMRSDRATIEARDRAGAYPPRRRLRLARQRPGMDVT
jgi:Tfp pilus assembly protein PilX